VDTVRRSGGQGAFVGDERRTDELLDWVARATGAHVARRGSRIQALWSGYGELFRVELEGGPVASAVVKAARPPARAEGVSDARKRRSYEVERAFYDRYASRCPDGARVARGLASRAEADAWVIVLEDLDASGFGARRRHLTGLQLDAALAWLATFHATFLCEPPEGLWGEGSYWQLDTRREELAALGDRALIDAAERLHGALTACPVRTLVHGDAKDANLCFSADGARVAAVDFQYVGGGCAMRDVAYLLHGFHDAPAGEAHPAHLDAYFAHLTGAISRRSRAGESVPAAQDVEEAWRPLYPVAQADFLRFLLAWGPMRGSDGGEARRFIERVASDC
jgi:hypothetical protein